MGRRKGRCEGGPGLSVNRLVLSQISNTTTLLKTGQDWSKDTSSKFNLDFRYLPCVGAVSPGRDTCLGRWTRPPGTPRLELFVPDAVSISAYLPPATRHSQTPMSGSRTVSLLSRCSHRTAINSWEDNDNSEVGSRRVHVKSVLRVDIFVHVLASNPLRRRLDAALVRTLLGTMPNVPCVSKLGHASFHQPPLTSVITSSTPVAYCFRDSL